MEAMQFLFSETIFHCILEQHLPELCCYMFDSYQGLQLVHRAVCGGKTGDKVLAIEAMW